MYGKRDRDRNILVAIRSTLFALHNLGLDPSLSLSVYLKDVCVSIYI